MPKVELNLDGLRQLKGGLVDLMLAKALNRVAIDLETAPDINTSREVSLKFKFKPVADIEGSVITLESVDTEFVVNNKVPERVTSARMRVSKATNGAKQFFFELDAPDNPDQMTLLPEERTA